MRLRNTRHSYGAVSITLHWVGALAVVMQLSSALMMARAASKATRLEWVAFHASVGVLMLLPLAARIVWHFAEPRPAMLSPNRRLKQVAGTVHAVLMALIACQLVTGLLNVLSGGAALRVIDGFTVPALTGTALRAQHDAIGTVHAACGLVIAALFAVHLGGVFKHLFGDGDDTFARMIGLTDEPADPAPAPSAETI